MDRRIKKTKSAIYDAFLRAKRNNPDVKPSVKELCALADINKTTFYRYFTDIDDLSLSIVDDRLSFLLTEDINVENLLVLPEVYFGQVVRRYRQYEADFNILFADNSHAVIFEAERLIKGKLVEITDKKYDDILLTFIAGGAVHFFMEKNYYDKNNLQKFCRIIRAAVSAFGEAEA